MATTDKLKITFPPTIDISTLSYIFIENGNVYDLSPSISGNAVTTTNINAVASSYVKIQIFNVTNPPSEAITDQFSLSILRNSYEVKSLQGVLQFNARRGGIIATVISTSLEIGVTTDYTFSVQL